MLDEIGNARLVLGRSLLEQGRLDEAEDALAAPEDRICQACRRRRTAPPRGSRRATWRPSGATNGAQRCLYRRAAEALQDFRF